MYVDESKRNGYLMAGVVVDASHAEIARRQLRALLLPGQERIHFKSENDSRRRQVLALSSEIAIAVAVATRPSEYGVRAARAGCLDALLGQVDRLEVARIVIEREDSLLEADRTLLFARLRSTSGRGAVCSYSWQRAHEEPLLWLADAQAWAHSKGGNWGRAAAAGLQVLALP